LIIVFKLCTLFETSSSLQYLLKYYHNTHLKRQINLTKSGLG